MDEKLKLSICHHFLKLPLMQQSAKNIIFFYFKKLNSRISHQRADRLRHIGPAGLSPVVIASFVIADHKYSVANL